MCQVPARDVQTEQRRRRLVVEPATILRNSLRPLARLFPKRGAKVSEGLLGNNGKQRPLTEPTRSFGVAMLKCEECGREADVVAHGWRTVLTYEENGSTETATYCPECAQREFGDGQDPPGVVEPI